MRWKLLRRRLSVSAPRVIVRSHLPWPLRWAVFALALGFSAALSLWAFEFGKEIAGLDRGARAELARLRDELTQLRAAHGQAQALANSADSLIKAERATQERLAGQIRTLEQQNADLARDLAFFERLLPAKDGPVNGLQVRGLQATQPLPGQLQYQVLVMRAQAARGATEWQGRVELTLAGTLDGKPWTLPRAGGVRAVTIKQYQRVEGVIEVPASAVVRQITVKLLDAAGVTLASETARV